VHTAAKISADRVTAATRDRIDWRHKGFPPAAQDVPIAEYARSGAEIFDFHAPILTLDAAAMRHNIATMRDWTRTQGLALAPHGKTTMAPQLFAKQLDAGAWAITAATINQVKVYRAFGISRITMANQLIDPVGLRWVAAESAADDDFEFSCWVDSEDAVALMTTALHGCPGQVDVLVELGGAGGRTGARDLRTAERIAIAIHASPSLRLAGVTGYEGAVAHGTDDHALRTVRDYLARLRELTLSLAAQGLFDGQVIVSAGGSMYFDLVAEELGAAVWPSDLDVLPVLRSGAYLTHDSGIYRQNSPLGAHARIPGVPPLRPAMRVWAQVQSVPEPGIALLTVGKRDISFDEGLPAVELLRHNGNITELAGAEITALNDQHGFCSLPTDSGVAVGDWIALSPSHPCTVFDKWQLIPVVDSDDGGHCVVDLVRTYF
jgi:D-serine deaminase-like pyridoxal phosphate-dependent protein